MKTQKTTVTPCNRCSTTGRDEYGIRQANHVGKLGLVLSLISLILGNIQVFLIILIVTLLIAGVEWSRAAKRRCPACKGTGTQTTIETIEEFYD